MGDEQVSGFNPAAGLIDKLKTLAEYAPLLGHFQTISNAQTPHDRALAVVKAMQWAAGKSATEVDDEVLLYLEAVLRTPEGKAFFEWVVAKVSGQA